MTPEFERLAARIDNLNEQIRLLFPGLAAARRAYGANQSRENREALQEIERKASDLHQESSRLVEMLPAASGLTAEQIEQAAERPLHRPDRSDDHTFRENLAADRVEITLTIDELLPRALETIEATLPKGWLDEQPRSTTRIEDLLREDAVLSLTKGVRLASENTSVHRFRQALHVSRDYMDGHPLYDHFGGALLVPTIVQLAQRDSHIQQVGGDREERQRLLWAGPSTQVDATIFELLTAAACVEQGRDVEFLEAKNKKSPDFRCRDHYPTVVECKRQQIVSEYESEEEVAMQAIFLALRKSAHSRGLFGTFLLTLSEEADAIDIDDVVSKLVGQRLAPDPERERRYAWGTIAFSPAPRTVELPAQTRIYSPNMLEYLFGWSSDLPEWDGICCSVDSGGEPIMNQVRAPTALIWKNVATNALRKRTWAPTNLFGKASFQVPPGEFGLVYVSYNEGGRPEVADMRVEAFSERIHDFEHSARIRIPIAVLSRLYPRPLREGQPDLIESGVQYVSGTYGDPSLFELYPTRIFT